MQCPSCGARMEPGSEQCSQCVATSEYDVIDPGSNTTTNPEQQISKLIEFPGVSRSTVPLWRKELSERVRELHEKRAREEALDLELEKTPSIEQADAPQLELLPQPAAAPVNPLVAAALRRIERAYETGALAQQSTQLARAAAVACAAPMLCDETSLDVAVNLEAPTPRLEEPTSQQPDKAHNLIVVPPTKTDATENVRKPRRLIGDLNDPALNYLDSVAVSSRFETSKHESASMLSRIASAVVDLFVVTLLCAPFAAALELINSDWNSPRVWLLAAAIFCIVGFLYFTISTALTGRTVGLRLLSLRVIDVRTGLIPTANQAAGRALIYLASLLILGLTSVFALLHPDRLTAHDRITRTSVVNG